uniref:Uncharacterized protein n=1 Tax=Setaria digitata TaxID=48799 RepID=A0A915Q7M2_9BILA
MSSPETRRTMLRPCQKDVPAGSLRVSGCGSDTSHVVTSEDSPRGKENSTE